MDGRDGNLLKLQESIDSLPANLGMIRVSSRWSSLAGVFNLTVGTVITFVPAVLAAVAPTIVLAIVAAVLRWGRTRGKSGGSGECGALVCS